MVRKGLSIFIAILCFGVILSGCAKKAVVKEDGSAKGAEELQTRKDAKEADRIREEEMKKEFEKSLVAKQTPGIEGVVLESKMLKDIHFEFDRYNISLEDVEILKENCALLKKYPGPPGNPSSTAEGGFGTTMCNSSMFDPVATNCADSIGRRSTPAPSSASWVLLM